MVTIGDRLREERLQLGMSQTKMADVGGVTKKTQALYEKGERHPDSRYLAAIAEAGADALYILTGNRSVPVVRSALFGGDHQGALSFSHLKDCLQKAIEDLEDAIEIEYEVGDGPVGHLPGNIKTEITSSLLKKISDPQLFCDFIHVPLHDVQGSCGAGSVIHSEQIVDYLAFKRDWVSRVATDPQRLALIEAAGDSMLPTISSGDLLLIDLCVARVEQDAIYAINVDGMLFIKRIQKRLDGTVIVKSDNAAYEAQRFTPEEAAQLRIIGRVIWMGKRL